MWPDSVRISDWFFRNKNSQLDNDNKRRRIDSPDLNAIDVPLHSSAGGGGDTQRGGGKDDNDDNDNPPVITATASVTASTSIDAMDVTDIVSSEQAASNIVYDEQDDSGDKTTIYQYGCQ